MAKSTVAVAFEGKVDGLKKSIEEVNGTLGGLFEKATSGPALVGVAVAGAAAGLFKLGEGFQEQFNKISTGTGATGKALEGLKDDFKNVAKDVPDSFDKVGSAITEVTQKLSLTGKPLEEVSKQFLDLSRITKTDLSANIQAATGVFNQFKIKGDEQKSTLDELYRATQVSGVSFGDLTSQISGSANVFQALGFNVEQATTVVAGLGKEGLSTADVMPALSKVLAEGAKTGKSAQTVYQDLIGAIKKAPSDVAASQIAFQELGAKAGPKFAELVRSGKFAFDNLGETIAEGSDTIDKGAKRAETFGEKWDIIKNRVLVGLEPLATGVFNGMGDAMDALGPAIDGLSRWFSDHLEPAMQAIGDWVQQNWPPIQQTITQVMTAISQVIQANVAVISALWDTFGANIMSAIQRVWPPIQQIVQGVMETIHGVIQTITSLIHGDWSGAWQGIQMIFQGVWNAIQGILKAALEAVRLGISVALTAIGALMSGAWDGIRGVVSGAWSSITSTVSSGVNGVVSFIAGMPGRIASAAHGMWNGIVADFKAALNAVIAAWNNFGIPSFHVHITMPSVIPNVDFDTPAIDFPNIPYLAAGGVVSQRSGGLLAMLGEGGSDEAVIPLSASGLRPLVDAIVARLLAVGGSAGSFSQLDSKTQDHLASFIESMLPDSVIPATGLGNLQDTLAALKQAVQGGLIDSKTQDKLMSGIEGYLPDSVIPAQGLANLTDTIKALQQAMGQQTAAVQQAVAQPPISLVGELVLRDPGANAVSQILQLLIPFLRVELQQHQLRNGPALTAFGF